MSRTSWSLHDNKKLWLKPFTLLWGICLAIGNGLGVSSWSIGWYEARFEGPSFRQFCIVAMAFPSLPRHEAYRKFTQTRIRLAWVWFLPVELLQTFAPVFFLSLVFQLWCLGSVNIDFLLFSPQTHYKHKAQSSKSSVHFGLEKIPTLG